MALLVPPPGLSKLLGENTVRISAATVGELLDIVRQRVGEEAWSEFARAFVLVNGVAAGRRAPLGEQDQVWLVFPAGGG